VAVQHSAFCFVRQLSASQRNVRASFSTSWAPSARVPALVPLGRSFAGFRGPFRGEGPTKPGAKPALLLAAPFFYGLAGLPPASPSSSRILSSAPRLTPISPFLSEASYTPTSCGT
jgi:hypothetical protein